MPTQIRVHKLSKRTLCNLSYVVDLDITTRSSDNEVTSYFQAHCDHIFTVLKVVGRYFF